MHNGELADPLSPVVQEIKEVSGKRKKTDEDHANLGKLEWIGSLYWSDELGGPYMPSDNIEKAIVDGAKKQRLGKNAQAALLVDDDDDIKIDFPDWGTPKDKLYSIGQYRFRKGVKVTTSRIMRERPRFPEWSIKFSLVFDESVIGEREVIEACQTAGALIGLGDWRPKYGRFEVEVL